MSCREVVESYKFLTRVYRKTKVPFIKCHALGNDFVLIDLEYKGRVDYSFLCDRHLGVGADDIIFYTLQNDGIRIEIRNPDGSLCEICGNAIFCSSNFFYHLNSENIASFWTYTDSGPKRTTLEADSKSIICEMGTFADVIKRLDFKFGTTQFTGYHLNVGVPHTIIFFPRVDDISLQDVGSYIEHHDFFEYATNVMLAEIRESNNIFIRCWERGGTGETFACGTGAYSTAIVAQQLGISRGKTIINFKHDNIEVDLSQNVYTMKSRSQLLYAGILPF